MSVVGYALALAKSGGGIGQQERTHSMRTTRASSPRAREHAAVTENDSTTLRRRHDHSCQEQTRRAAGHAQHHAISGDIKLHTLLDVRGSIPSFIHISDGKMHEVNVLDVLTPEPGAFYLLDRGYMDFARLHALHGAGSFFLIRAKRGLRFKRRYSQPVDRTNTQVLCDQIGTLEVYYSKQGYPTALRRVVVRDEDGKRPHVPLETVALGAHEDQAFAGLGREPEDGDPAWRQQQELLAHGANPGAAAGTVQRVLESARAGQRERPVVQSAGLHHEGKDFVERADLLNRPLRTRMVGGVGGGG